ncbi:biotin/lipoyl-binding carrier protein [Cumulibacter soli]|uniref:biotin/lipoyl-binding carrier protein n=1 Tax=Cumulibacter soli TaxID=2546344 RepID=UPI001068940F|nr:biotin/lipoyl-binding carrier protein [Cumulibacter soli]
MTQRIVAEMTASVWKILVKEGQTVTEGQELLILESMKMEIPVSAEAEGAIAAIAVQEGDSVAQGDTLIDLT